MTARQRRTTEAMIRAAIRAAREEGIDIGAVEVQSGGTVRILAPGAITGHPDGKQGDNTCDALFGAARR